MSEIFDTLPPRDRRMVRRMAEETGVEVNAMMAQIVRAYAGLVHGAPDALPNDPLRRLTTRAIRKAGY